MSEDGTHMVQPDIDPGNAYRRLMPYERLRPGDEFWCGNGKWCLTRDEGCLANELPYRRMRKLPNAEAHGRALARTVQPLVDSLDGDK